MPITAAISSLAVQLRRSGPWQRDARISAVLAMARQSLALRDEARSARKLSALVAERRQRGVGLRDQVDQPVARAVDAEHGDQRRLAGGGVLAGGFAERGGVAFDVEQVVGDLERLAERAP